LQVATRSDPVVFGVRNRHLLDRPTIVVSG
jgi:hypothetical protein